MQDFVNVDLFAVGVAVASSLILGFIVYYRDAKSATSRLFLLFTIVNSFWSIVNYLSYQVYDVQISLWLVRLVLFFAVFQSFSFYLLTDTFPSNMLLMGKNKLSVLSLISCCTGIFTLSPLVFSHVKISQAASVPSPVVAPGIIVFAATTLLFVFLGITTLLKKMFEANREEKSQFQFVVLGVGLMFILIVIFNFVLPSFFGYTRLIPLGAVFTLPFTVLTTYAIVKHRLFDVKVLGTEILIFLLIIVTSAEVVLSKTYTEVALRSAAFVLLLGMGILLIKSVLREVEQRKKLEDLTLKLRELDQQKNEFISMAAHELRAPMTAIKGYISMILEGDTGDIPEKARGFLADATSINDRMVRLVNNMLNVSRIEEGRMSFQFDNDELSRVIRTVYSQFLPEAQRKNLDYKLDIQNQIKDKVYADVDKLHEIAGNLISNAIKYTEKGHVYVRLVQPDPGIIRFEVEDSGPGISAEEQVKLFQKFYRVESNVGKTTGTGLGLYISRLMIEKFKGKIGLNSEPGRGSTFWFELPVVSS